MTILDIAQAVWWYLYHLWWQDFSNFWMCHVSNKLSLE